MIVDDTINIEEATEFVHEIIGAQLLVSELAPSITGEEFTSELLSALKIVKGGGENDFLNAVYDTILEVQSKLKQLDQQTGASHENTWRSEKAWRC